MKITVAIPHYNSLDTLWKLLAQLREDSFDEIVVLDDNSDIKPNKLEAEFPAVRFEYGSENVGAGANRNRILELVNEGIIWFVDTDMEVVSLNNADRLRSIFKKDQNRMIGGLIYTKSGEQMEWNYGHEMHPVHDARFEELIVSLRAGNTLAVKRLKEHKWDYPWVHSSLGQPRERRVDWVAEGSFALSIDLFRRVGGYDPGFRYHGDQDLARRLRQLGISIQSMPDIITRHLEVDVRGDKNRADEFNHGQYLFFQKHWGMSREIYEALYG